MKICIYYYYYAIFIVILLHKFWHADFINPAASLVVQSCICMFWRHSNIVTTMLRCGFQLLTNAMTNQWSGHSPFWEWAYQASWISAIFQKIPQNLLKENFVSILKINLNGFLPRGEQKFRDNGDLGRHPHLEYKLRYTDKTTYSYMSLL